MPTGIKDLRIYEIGKETAHAPNTTATNRLVSEMLWNPNEVAYEPQPQIGVMMENPTTDLLLKRWTDVNWKGELTYEQILYLLEASIRGGQTPVGAMADKTYTYSALATADPSLTSYTLQRRMTDGTTSWDENCAFALINNFKLSAAVGAPVMFDANWFARPIDLTPTLTPAIAVPSVNFIAAADVIVSIDNTYGALGGRPITESVVDWTLSVDPQYQPKFFQDGRSDRSFSNYGLKRLQYNLQIKCETNALIMDKTTGERAKAAGRNFRYVRIKATGAALGGSTYLMQIDGIFRYKEGQFDSDGDHEGNDMVTLDLIGTYDSANTTPIKFTVTNALAAIP